MTARSSLSRWVVGRLGGMFELQRQNLRALGRLLISYSGYVVLRWRRALPTSRNTEVLEGLPRQSAMVRSLVFVFARDWRLALLLLFGPTLRRLRIPVSLCASCLLTFNFGNERTQTVTRSDMLSRSAVFVPWHGYSSDFQTVLFVVR